MMQLRWECRFLMPLGLLGRIVESYPNYSKVLLLLDRSSAVDAIVQPNRLRGILAGVGANRCLLH